MKLARFSSILTWDWKFGKQILRNWRLFLICCPNDISWPFSHLACTLWTCTMPELRRQTGSLRIGAAEVHFKHRWYTGEKIPWGPKCDSDLGKVLPPVLIHKNAPKKTFVDWKEHVTNEDNGCWVLVSLIAYIPTFTLPEMEYDLLTICLTCVSILLFFVLASKRRPVNFPPGPPRWRKIEAKYI